MFNFMVPSRSLYDVIINWVGSNERINLKMV